MNEKQDRDLDVLSGIDEKIVDKQTVERYHRMTQLKKKSRKKWIVSATAMAASLALILSAVFILVPILGKQVPIYTGMTVSGKPDGSTTVSVQSTTDFLSHGVSGDYYGSHGEPNHDHPFDGEKEPIKDAVSDVLDIRSARDIYYTEPNTDIYITVHFDNPDDFLIQGFTLGGKTYANYMFEEGSDMENIIIKVSVGNREGVIDYTIDGITYIDGEKIKNVKMQGDRTVCVGVQTDKQPTAAISNEVIEYNAIRFTVATNDLLGLVARSEGELFAVLYDGDTIVATEKIAAVGESEISFEGLVTGKLYQYAIVATYDALDGTGKNAYILLQKSVYTKSIVLFDVIDVGESEIRFSLLWDADFENKTLNSLTLYQGESVLRELDVTATAAEGLAPDTAYALVATYRNGSATEEIRIDFITDKIYYTVNHYQENLSGGYDLIEENRFEIAQGATHTPDPNTYTGFVTPAAQIVTGTPNANAVINYYYDRIVSTVTYIDNNGNTDTTDLKCGAPFASPAARENFVFDGWYSDEKLTAAVDAMPDHATTLYAKWIAETPVSLFSYQLTDTNDGYIITGISDKTLQTLCLPPYIGGLPVVGIGDSAFYNMPDLVEVTLQEGVQTIGKLAFKDCKQLKTITIPASMKSIGTNAFVNVTADRVNVSDLAAWCSIDFADAFSNPVRNAALYLNGAVVTDLQIPAGVTEIKPHAFARCSSIVTVQLPASVERIGAYAFASCAALSHVSASAGLKYIGASAFASCRELRSVSLPDGLISLGNRAFSDCILLESVALPTTLLELGRYAFQDCTSLESIAIPAGVIKISDEILEGCTSLVSITVPFVGASATATEASESAVLGYLFGTFEYRGKTYAATQNGVTYYIPNTLNKVTVTAQSIPQGAFSGVTSLSEVVLGAGVKKIGNEAFSGCSALATVTVSAALTEIGSAAFSGCAVERVNISDLAAWCSIDFADRESNPLHCSAALYLDDGLVTNLSCLSGVSEIKQYAFVGCTSLKYGGIPNGITTISKYAFADVKSLTALVLPASITSIGSAAFSGCKHLFEVYDLIPDISIVAGKPTNGHAAYYARYVYTSLDDERKIYEIDDYFFDISGTENVLFAYAGKDADLVLPESCNGENYVIGMEAFGFYIQEEDTDNTRLTYTSVTIPSAVTEIRAYAFMDCKNLKVVNIEPGVKLIGEYAFFSCAIETLVLPSGVTKIDDDAFGGCESLVSVQLPDTLKDISWYAFGGCERLTRVNIPASMTYIGLGAFSGTALSEAIFEGDSTWKLSDQNFRLTPSDLADPASAAAYLLEYWDSYWTVVK